MPATGAIRVHGLADLNRALKQADRQTRLGIRKVEREVAEPVRRDAEELAAREISHIGTKWSTMRIGVTQRLVYVAPKMRRKQGTPRPNLAGLLMDKAMQPALEKNEALIVSRLEEAIDQMADNFNRGA